MILRKLELKHFGKFGERTFEFRRGMNLVTGPNEAGKSTLMEAIPAVLFGVRNKERFKPWGRQGECAASLMLEDRNRSVQVERDILTDRVVLIERDDLYHTLYHFEGKAAPQGRSSERAEYLAQLSRLFGVAEDDVFRASLFFGQGSLELSGQGGLGAKLKALLSGFVEVDYDQVLDSLNRDFFAITRQNPWGKDKTRDRDLEEVRKELAELEKRWFATRDARQELAALHERVGTLQEELEAGRVEYDKGERYLAWVRKQWHLEEKEESLRRHFTRVSRQTEKIGELEKRRQALERQIAGTGLPREIPEGLPLLLADAEKIRKELVALQGEAATLRQQLLELPSTPWWQAGCLTGALLAVGGGITWWRPQWATVSLLVAALLSAPVWIFFLWRFGIRRAERSRIKGQGQVLERSREEAQARLSELDERFEKLGMSPSAVEIVRMQKNLETHQQLAAQLLEVESALRVLENAEELGREKEDLTRELAVLDERREQEPSLRRKGLLSPEDLPEAEEKLRALGERLKAGEKELLDLTRREATLQGELADSQQIEEEGERLKEREQLLVRRRDVLGLAVEWLSGAVDEFRSTYLERFAADVGRNLALVTAGAHGEVRLDDDLTFALRGKGNSWQPLERFSCGTRDSVYFAVRLALTRHLSRGRRLPLFLDDPLVNLDRSRLAEALTVLERLSGEHQVLLFSHNDNLLRRGASARWHVVSLDEVKAEAPAARERSEDVGQLYLL